jgi:hypothetical protein
MTKHSQDNVVSFEARQLFSRFPALARIEGYWETLRQGRTAPARSEIDPRGLENVLENAFVLDSVAPGVARLRVAGNHLSDLMGMEVRGMPMTALAMPEARDELMNALEFVFKGGKAHFMTTSPRGFGRGEIVGGMVLLPLTDSDGRITKVLGALQSFGKIGREPRRLQFTDVQLIRGEMPDPEAVAAPVFDLDTPAMPGEALDGSRKLRLVVDNS